jgi:hypothetical protein
VCRRCCRSEDLPLSGFPKTWMPSREAEKLALLRRTQTVSASFSDWASTFSAASQRSGNSAGTPVRGLGELCFVAVSAWAIRLRVLRRRSGCAGRAGVAPLLTLPRESTGNRIKKRKLFEPRLRGEFFRFPISRRLSREPEGQRLQRRHASPARAARLPFDYQHACNVSQLQTPRRLR